MNPFTHLMERDGYHEQMPGVASGIKHAKFKCRTVEFQGECRGTITDETEDAIYIISQFFTGWMYKAEFFDLLGIED